MKSRIAMGIILCAAALAHSAWADDASDEIASRGPVQLSMRKAVQMATSPEGSTRIQLQMENMKQAKYRSAEVRAGLLPDVEGYVGVQSSVRSLAAAGLTQIPSINQAIASVDTFLPDFLPNGVPDRTGVFHALDIRGTGQMVAFDWSIWQRLRSAHAGIKAAKDDFAAADDQVTGQVARAYLSALRTDAEVEAVQGDVDLSQAVLTQSQHQKDAGSGTGIDVTRAKVQLANDKQRMLVAKNNQTKAHLQLLRVMNMRLDSQVELTDKLVYKPMDAMNVEDAVAQAMANRPDLQAQLRHEDSAHFSARAVKAERLPSVVTQFNYGTIGPQDIHLLPTREYYGAVRIPVFDGGRRDARRQEANSQFRQEKVRTADLRDQIELDIRSALDSLKSASEQVEVAQEGLKLSETELAQARRRYEAGVAGSLDVSEASDRMQRARGNEIDAVFNHSLARIDLGQALGKTIAMID